MRPVENLPGRQASRALINLLLPKYQVLQQRKLRRGGFAIDSNDRRHSLPSIAPQSAASAGQSSGTAAGFFTKCGSGYRRTGAPAAAVVVWHEETKDGIAAVSVRSIATPTRGEGAASELKHARAPEELTADVDRGSGERTHLPSIGVLEDHDAASTGAPMLSEHFSTEGPEAMRTAGTPLRQQATASPTTAEAAAPRLDEKPKAERQASSTPKSSEETPTTSPSIPPAAALELGAARASRFPETQRCFERTATEDDGSRDARGSMTPEPPPAPGSPCNTCLALPRREQRPEEEVWEAFYFYQRGGIKARGRSCDLSTFKIGALRPPSGQIVASHRC